MEQTTNTATESDLPQQIGDYEVQKFIGRGKFAVVYRAKKIGSETSVALKRISVDLMDEKTREKCLKEVRLLQNLDHKNIIRYLDSFILENDLIIVFEWAAAGDLKRQLRKAIERGNGFDERTIWKYFSQICDAMQHMHERRIMHRDLKPANIFLTLDGTIKVGDLGLSREMSEHTMQAHSKVGTPLYMSPEVLNGEGYDFKSDIWSLGCLLYELAALKSPFKQEGMNIYALCQKIASGDFQPLPDTYSEDLRTLVYSMISTQPKDRPEIGSVCETARRLRIETQDRKKKSITNNLSNEANAAVATVNSFDSAANEGMRKERQQPQPSTEFDIKPPTANYGNTKESKPAQWDLEFDTKPTTATSVNNRISTGDDNEQTDTWEDKWNRKRESNSRTDSKPSNREEDSSYAPTNIRSVGIASQNRLRRSDSKDVEDNFKKLSPKNSNPSMTVKSNTSSKNNTTAKSPSPNTWANGKDDNDGSEDNFISIPIKPNNSNSNSNNHSSYGVNGVVPIVYSDAPQPVTHSAVTAAPTRRLKSSENHRTGSATGNRPSSQQRPDSKEGFNSDAPSRVPSATNKNNSSNASTKIKGRFPPPQSNPNKFKENFFSEAMTAFALSEDLYSKLILLNYSPYEDGFDLDDDDDEDVFAPIKSKDGKSSKVSHTKRHRGGPSTALLPMHFACDLQVYDVAGRSTNQQFFQFKRMVCIAIWLTKLLNSVGLNEVIKTIDRSLDVPLTTAKQVLRLAQNALSLNPNVSTVISAADLNAIVASTLTSGYGYNVCCVLLVLADCVLASGRVIVKPCVYENKLDSNQLQTDLESDEIDEDADLKGRSDNIRRHLSEDEDVDDDNHDQQEISDVYQHSFASGGGNNVISSMLFGAPIDPVLWKEETERVGRALATHQAMANSNLLGATEWSNHIQLLRNYSDMTSEERLTMSSVNKDKSTVAVNTGRAILISELVTNISHIKGFLDANMKQIRTAESYLNNKHSMSALTYSSVKKEHSDLETRLVELQANINTLSNELATIEENKEVVDSELQAKIDTQGGTGGGSNIIVKLNEALINIKKEIRDFHITINVLNASLMHVRQQEQVDHREKVRTKAASAKAKRKI